MAPQSSPKSTNVRAHLAPWFLRVGFAAASTIAPQLAAAAAERLFLSPPRRRTSRRMRGTPTGGEPFVVSAGGERLRAWRFGDGPSVLLVHGWGGRGGQLATFTAPLLAAGCSVVAFDAPGHGLSSGRLASGIAFAEAVATVARHVGARAAIGHSLGATGLGWAIGGGLRLDSAVMIAPARGAAAFYEQFCDALTLQPTVRAAVRARIKRRFGVAPEDFDLPARVAGASTPALVVHDLQDREVPWADGAEIARAWPGARMISTDGLGHRSILRDASVAATAASFVLSHLARCACGRLASRAGRCETCALERELFERDGASA